MTFVQVLLHIFLLFLVLEAILVAFPVLSNHSGLYCTLACICTLACSVLLTEKKEVRPVLVKYFRVFHKFSLFTLLTLHSKILLTGKLPDMTPCFLVFEKSRRNFKHCLKCWNQRHSQDNETGILSSDWWISVPCLLFAWGRDIHTDFVICKWPRPRLKASRLSWDTRARILLLWQ